MVQLLTNWDSTAIACHGLPWFTVARKHYITDVKFASGIKKTFVHLPIKCLRNDVNIIQVAHVNRNRQTKHWSV